MFVYHVNIYLWFSNFLLIPCCEMFSFIYSFILYFKLFFDNFLHIVSSTFSRTFFACVPTFTFLQQVSLMIQKYKDLATVIKMQKESDDVYDRALACVRSYLDRPGTEKQQKIQEKLAKERRKMEQQRKEELEKKLKSGGDTTFSFHVRLSKHYFINGYKIQTN